MIKIGYLTFTKTKQMRVTKKDSDNLVFNALMNIYNKVIQYNLRSHFYNVFVVGEDQDNFSLSGYLICKIPDNIIIVIKDSSGNVVRIFSEANSSLSIKEESISFFTSCLRPSSFYYEGYTNLEPSVWGVEQEKNQKILVNIGSVPIYIETKGLEHCYRIVEAGDKIVVPDHLIIKDVKRLKSFLYSPIIPNVSFLHFEAMMNMLQKMIVMQEFLVAVNIGCLFMNETSYLLFRSPQELKFIFLYHDENSPKLEWEYSMLKLTDHNIEASRNLMGVYLEE